MFRQFAFFRRSLFVVAIAAGWALATVAIVERVAAVS